METDNTFNQLLMKYRTVVERYINYRMPTTHDADDVIQETYLTAFEHFCDLRSYDLFKPWILTIAKNQCNLWYRRLYGTEQVSLEAMGDVLEAPELVYDDTVATILRRIPADLRTVLQLTLDGYKQAEIAEKMRIPIGTVKSRLHYAKKLFRDACPPEIKAYYERGNKTMAKKDYTCGFPMEMPALIIQKSTRPFTKVKCEDETFIIPRIGQKNSEGTYRYPDKKLAIVSTCYVPKAAVVHEVAGVKICRDTYNVKADKLYKNECIWFSQLTEEYVRDLGTIAGDADDEYPTAIYTFLEEDYDVIVNGKDRIHGRPLLIKENPPKIENGKLYVDESHERYTIGTYDVIIGDRAFETIAFIRMQNNTIVTENYVDSNGRLILMRWYESMDSLKANDNFSEQFIDRIRNNPVIMVNDIQYIHIEDRISQYAL
ncbi:MAG: RNA polymerase sigma factor [Clostridia bacterium]|nr:RNA polymerase sigma factor [Clostridia bacterium]